jgi:hypothetical protein
LPQAIFLFIDRWQGNVVAWWPTARREATAMARVVYAFYADVGAPLAPILGATDAMGAAEHGGDCGGFGVVVADVGHDIVEECFRQGFRPGLAMQRDLGLEGVRNPDRPLLRTVPFTRLPPALFDRRTQWLALAQGRWAFAEHITLGELRAVLKLLALLAANARCHRSKFLTLQENLPVSSMLAKGRSSRPLLNFLLRRRAAMCCAAEITLLAPWVESGKQPADDASRQVGGPPEGR